MYWNMHSSRFPEDVGPVSKRLVLLIMAMRHLWKFLMMFMQLPSTKRNSFPKVFMYQTITKHPSLRPNNILLKLWLILSVQLTCWFKSIFKIWKISSNTTIKTRMWQWTYQLHQYYQKMQRCNKGRRKRLQMKIF